MTMPLVNRSLSKLLDMNTIALHQHDPPSIVRSCGVESHISDIIIPGYLDDISTVIKRAPLRTARPRRHEEFQASLRLNSLLCSEMVLLG